MDRRFTILLLLCLFASHWAAAQNYTVRGTFRDADTREPLIGVNVRIAGTGIGAATDLDGNFTLSAVPEGSYTLEASSLGFENFQRSIRVSADLQLGTLNLKSTALTLGGEVVVSATRRPERLTDAPASIGVITSRDLDNLPSFNVGELLNKVQGVEVVRSGVIGIGINARGFNSAFNVRMLQLNDGRNGMLPGGTGLPAGFYNTIIKEDIERIEVILGPASALYGPNAHAGVVNTLTKDPRSSEGTTVVFGGGNQSVLSGRFRHANVVNEKLAFKVNAEYTQGRDFEFIDTVYIGAIGVPELAPDFNFRSIRANAAVYYSIKPDADLIVDYGIGQGSNIGVTNLGRNQIDGWTFSYLQARYVSPRVFAQLYNSWNNAGNTFQINGRTVNYQTLLAAGLSPEEAKRRSLLPVEEGGLGFPGFKDESSRLNGEFQYNNSVGSRFNYVLGASFQRDVANSLGTYLFDIDGDIIINQFGVVTQMDYALTDKLKFVGAARVDYHDYYDLQFSPRLALTHQVGENGAVRLTYGRAYAAPSIQFLEFLFPIAGVNGAIIGSGQGLTVENLVTGDRRMIDPLQPEVNQTFEFGYKGLAAKKLFVDATAWYGITRDFISPAVNLFVGGERIVERGGQPIPENLSGINLTYLNFGEVNNWGIDLGFTYNFNANYSFGAKYSYFGSDITQADKFEDDPNLALLSHRLGRHFACLMHLPTVLILTLLPRTYWTTS
ncbi:TonB-dependent receptor [Nitritalea halalkaliphila]|uniref:TonB-dependent receptor n=1 Tax=Nitritalea halalkaliphila TaxID=590849 RepID=UPI0002D8486C|nr:TonB-dependent receptor [Nitritalea halalkaliphila]